MKNKYSFKPYDKNYPRLFQKEKAKLRKIISKSDKIEHVGSTAVPGLGGKGIIDIMISVNKGEVLKTKKKLINAGYKFKASGGERGRLFFKKQYNYANKLRIVHLQLTTYKSHIEKRMLNFKKKLLENKEFREKYAKLKKQGVKLAKGDGKIYRKHKEAFIKKVK